MTDSPDFLYEKKGPIAIMTWNRPDKRNCFTPQMIDDYYAALDDFNQDPELRVVVVASTGEQAWCSGGDLDAMIPAITSGEWKINEDPTKRIYSDIFKPIICAVNGFATLELVQGADLCVASENASFVASGDQEGERSDRSAEAVRLRRPVPSSFTRKMSFLSAQAASSSIPAT